jgi:dGTPase
MVQELFHLYCESPDQMQAGFAARTRLAEDQAEGSGVEPSRQRVVADYIAGMTDRFAAREHVRLTGKNLLLGESASGG